MSIKLVPRVFRPVTIFGEESGLYVKRRVTMKNILFRLLWEVVDLAQLFIKDYLADKEGQGNRKPIAD